MAWQKKNPRYSEETPWFPEYCIGWIGIGNCGQKTSTVGTPEQARAARPRSGLDFQIHKVEATY